MTPEPSKYDEVMALIEDIFQRRGAKIYLGEAVTVAEHMLQTAALAQNDGAPDTLVVAALLHDIGHFVGDLSEPGDEDAIDRGHDVAGATLLEGLFPPAVVECVRLHVAAKRFLCAADGDYRERLSSASKHSLILQGGPMSEAETAEFRSLEFHRQAVSVRLWDDAGKTVEAVTPKFDAFRPMLKRVLRQGEAR